MTAVSGQVTVGGKAYPVSAQITLPGLPPGVTLRAIDGGPTYYADNGFTNAATPLTATGPGSLAWDNPEFFPIGLVFPNQSYTPAQLLETGCNFAHNLQATPDYSAWRKAGVWVWYGTGDHVGTNMGQETVAVHDDEPNGYAAMAADMTAAASSPGIAGRFLQISGTHYQLDGGYGDCPCGTSMNQVMSCTSGMPGGRHLNTYSIDVYWFAAAPQGASYGIYSTQDLYGVGSPTSDQLARGSNYGDMVDTFRAGTATHPAPLTSPYIETANGLLGGTTNNIRPEQYNWAAWSSIVHGARGILAFVYNYPTAASTGAWAPISMASQAPVTHGAITNLAPILNSPFALGYVTSATPGGYRFPGAHAVLDNGIEIMVKYYTGGTYSNSLGTFGNGFYVFVTVRGSQAQANVAATFNIAGNYAGAIPVIKNLCGPSQSTGTVTVSGHRFTDTLATAYDVRAYGPIPNV